MRRFGAAGGAFALHRLCQMSTVRNDSSRADIAEALSGMRQEYSSNYLDMFDHPGADPMTLFKRCFEAANKGGILEPNAMCVSTCGDSQPTARFVLLKDFDDRGFVWYTNYESRKAQDLASNPNAAITFWWGPLELQIRIEGIVEKVSSEESDAYYAKRPRGSQIGAWASAQSREIASREEINELEVSTKERFKDTEVIPRPPHWGGYRLIPCRIEFWKGRTGRMHDRVLFERAKLDPATDQRKGQYFRSRTSLCRVATTEAIATISLVNHVCVCNGARGTSALIFHCSAENVSLM